MPCSEILLVVVTETVSATGTLPVSWPAASLVVLVVPFTSFVTLASDVVLISLSTSELTLTEFAGLNMFSL